MLIEVCGADGSGKSTMIDGLRRALRSEGLTVYERVVRSESRNLLQALQEQDGAVRIAQREVQLVVLLDALRYAQADLSSYRGSERQHAFVTGHRVALTARLSRSGLKNDVALRAVLEAIPAPDYTIAILTPPATALQRLQDRAKGDSVLSEKNPLRSLAAADASLRCALGGTPHLSVPPELGPEVALREALPTIRNVLRPEGARDAARRGGGV